MGIRETGKTAYDRVVDHFGGVEGLAVELGITDKAIYLWRGRIPRGRTFEIESITKGKFVATDLINDGKRRA